MNKIISGEKGQHMAMAALLMPLLLAVMGLVIDVGFVYTRQRMAQNAADSAAQAGALVLKADGTSAAVNAALYYAAQSGFNNDGSTNTVVVNIPPTAGAFSGNSHYVQVRVTNFVNPIMSGIVYNGTYPVGSMATAGYQSSSMGAPVIVLDRSACSALGITGSAWIKVPNGNIHVNSNCSTAMTATGSAIIETQSPMTIVGGYRATGSVTFSQTPRTGQPVQSDPLLGLVQPNPSDYTIRGAGTAAVPKTWKFTGSSSATLYPGTYYGGLSFTGSNIITLMPGIYVMAGSGFSVTGSTRITGSNVFIYITNDPSHPTGDGDWGNMKLTGSQSVTLTPPATGTYAGMLIMQDRNDSQTADMTGSTSLSGTSGIIYLPAATLNMTGSGDLYMNFVVDQLRMTGSTVLTVQGYTGPGWSNEEVSLTE
jgi:Flp pilus assembly protein TadG